MTNLNNKMTNWNDNNDESGSVVSTASNRTARRKNSRKKAKEASVAAGRLNTGENFEATVDFGGDEETAFQEAAAELEAIGNSDTPFSSSTTAMAPGTAGSSRRKKSRSKKNRKRSRSRDMADNSAPQNGDTILDNTSQVSASNLPLVRDTFGRPDLRYTLAQKFTREVVEDEKEREMVDRITSRIYADLAEHGVPLKKQRVDSGPGHDMEALWKQTQTPYKKSRGIGFSKDAGQTSAFKPPFVKASRLPDIRRSPSPTASDSVSQIGSKKGGSNAAAFGAAVHDRVGSYQQAPFNYPPLPPSYLKPQYRLDKGPDARKNWDFMTLTNEMKGKPLEVKSFLRNLQEFFDTYEPHERNGLAEKNRTRRHLASSVQEWFDTQADIIDWPTAKAAIMEEFAPMTPRSHIEGKFKALKWTADLTFAQFSTQFLALVNHAKALQLPEPLTPLWIHKKFMKRIENAKHSYKDALYEHLRSKNVAYAEQAKDAAARIPISELVKAGNFFIRAENFNDPRAAVGSSTAVVGAAADAAVVRRTPISVAHVTAPPPPPDITCLLCGQPGHHAFKCSLVKNLRGALPEDQRDELYRQIREERRRSRPARRIQVNQVHVDPMDTDAGTSDSDFQ